MPLTTVRLLARALARRGARHAFGVPGGETLPLIQALADEGVDFVLVRHEGSAGFAADACAQLTGGIGVCVATLGPGATNLVSGLAGCLLDRAPVVAITGQVPEHRVGVYTHQTLDQRALFAPVCKHSVTLSAQEAWREIPLALRRLLDGRPGPVHLNVPTDVSGAEQPGVWPDDPPPRLGLPDVSAARARLAASRRPAILVGPGVLRSAAGPALEALAEACGAPVWTTYKAKGILDEHHPLSAGAVGLSPPVDALARGMLAEADLLLLIGYDAVEMRPHWLPGWPGALPVVAIDRSPPLDLLCAPVETLVGDIPGILAALTGPAGGGWVAERLARYRVEVEALFLEEPGTLGPATAIRAVQAALPPDAVATLDVGAHRITASHVWRCAAPSTLLQSNGFSSMGYGLPAAIGARLSCPERPVVAIVGDGGLQMSLGELGVVAERGLDLVVVVLVDESLALIELKQRRMGLPLRGVRLGNPDFGAVARAYGGVGARAETPEAVRRAVAEAVARGGLTIVEAPIDAGAYNRQM
ncbi:MAG: thiamine pyrophosphate-binding protein [Alphaproteobacteria bacterium]|nr:thiamine pyrophosphate-binding protein [Alphaproteobacteria bacterium]